MSQCGFKIPCIVTRLCNGYASSQNCAEIWQFLILCQLTLFLWWCRFRVLVVGRTTLMLQDVYWLSVSWGERGEGAFWIYEKVEDCRHRIGTYIHRYIYTYIYMRTHNFYSDRSEGCKMQLLPTPTVMPTSQTSTTAPNTSPLPIPPGIYVWCDLLL